MARWPAAQTLAILALCNRNGIGTVRWESHGRGPCCAEVWEKRHAKGLPLRPVLLHTGYIKDAGKSVKLREMGLWAADEWRPSMAPPALRHTMKLRTGGSDSRAWLLLAPVLAGLGLIAWRRAPSKAELRHQDGNRRAGRR